MLKIAAFTMAHNEKVFLPIWLQHYGKHLGHENCFVIDHGSTDGSTSGLGWNCVRLPPSTLDENDRCKLVMSFQRFLLASYDVVIFSDTDEIIVYDLARYRSFYDMMDKNTENVMGGVGLALTHAQDIERPIDLRYPILVQRRFARFQSLYCKPLVGRTAIDWTPGFHSCRGRCSLNKYLYIFHLKAFDLPTSLDMLAQRRGVSMSDQSISLGQNEQFRFSDEEFIRTYFPLRGDDFDRVTPDGFMFDEFLQERAISSLDTLERSFRKTFELPDRLKIQF